MNYREERVMILACPAAEYAFSNVEDAEALHQIC